MQTISLKIPEDLLEDVEELSDQEFDSRSETLRHLIREGFRARELDQEIDSLEAELADLRSQLRARQDRERDVEELANFADQERELRRRRERLRLERESAGLLTRLRWYVRGRDLDLDADDQDS